MLCLSKSTNLLIDEVLGVVYFAERQFVVIFVHLNVNQISVEWMNILRKAKQPRILKPWKHREVKKQQDL